MKWFKHYTNAHKGKVIHAMIPEFGWPGAYGIYFLLVEYITDKWDGGGDHSFKFSTILVRKYLELSPKKFRKLGEILSESSEIKFVFSKDFVEIYFPKLAEIQHRDALSSSMRLEKIQSKSSVEENKNKNKNKNKKNHSNFDSLESLLEAIPKKTKDSWSALYPAAYIERQQFLAWNYYASNPPKSLTGWSRTVGGWLERGWRWQKEADARSRAPETGGWEHLDGVP